MARTSRSLQITDAYRAELLSLRANTGRIVGDRFLAAPDDLRSFYQAAAILIAGGQQDAVRLTNTYAEAFTISELRQVVAIDLADPTEYVGRARDGRSVSGLLLPVAFAMELARRRGRPENEVTTAGLARAVRVARTEVTDAARQAMASIGGKNAHIVGWRRVTSSAPCGACLGEATGVVKRADATMRIHPSCSCTAEPVIDGVADGATRPTGQEIFSGMTPAQQDALFEGTGGKAKADLIRSGVVAIEQLVTVRAYLGLRDVITETPLEALAS